MDFRNIAVLAVISLLLFGTACAQKTVNDFKIDGTYDAAYNGNNHSLYLNQKQDSGIAIFKNVAGDVDEDDGAHDNLIHEGGRDYLTSGEDMKIDKNSDNTFNFTDYDYCQHGIGEVIKCDGDEYVVVFFAKESSHVNNPDLITKLNEFNKDNDVKATGL